MSIYKDFILITSGILIGSYISKLDENSPLKEKYDKMIYQIKPVIRKIKDNFIEFLNESDINIKFEDLKVNFENSIEILKTKIKELKEIEDPNKKFEFIQSEIITILNSIHDSFMRQKDFVEEATLSTQLDDVYKKVDK